MTRAAEIKKGNVVEHNGTVYQVRDIERSAAQGRSGNVTFRFIMYSVPGGTKFDLSLRADDEISEVELVGAEANFSYMDGDAFVFLDTEDYTPYQLDASVIGDSAGFITEGLEGCYVQLIDDAPEARQARHRPRDPGPRIHQQRRKDLGQHRHWRVRRQGLGNRGRFRNTARA